MRQTGFCRPMKRGEEAGVEHLLNVAFGGREEADLLRQLRKDRAIAGEMLIPSEQGDIVGYYALSQFRAPKGWLCLAPVAVHPDWQGQGHGRRMIGQLAAWAAAAGQTVVVLGQPEFYGRAGFSAKRAARLRSPYPLEHTLLAGPGDQAPDAELRYPSAFDGL